MGVRGKWKVERGKKRLNLTPQPLSHKGLRGEGQGQGQKIEPQRTQRDREGREG
jgi:hypothetical protein